MRTWQRLGSLMAVVLLGAVLVVAAGQRHPPTFTPEQDVNDELMAPQVGAISSSPLWERVSDSDKVIGASRYRTTDNDLT